MLWMFLHLNPADGRQTLVMLCSALIHSTLFAFRGPGTGLFDYLWVTLWSGVCFVHMCSVTA